MGTSRFPTAWFPVFPTSCRRAALSIMNGRHTAAAAASTLRISLCWCAVPTPASAFAASLFRTDSPNRAAAGWYPAAFLHADPTLPAQSIVVTCGRQERHGCRGAHSLLDRTTSAPRACSPCGHGACRAATPDVPPMMMGEPTSGIFSSQAMLLAACGTATAGGVAAYLPDEPRAGDRTASRTGSDPRRRAHP